MLLQMALFIIKILLLSHIALCIYWLLYPQSTLNLFPVFSKVWSSILTLNYIGLLNKTIYDESEIYLYNITIIFVKFTLYLIRESCFFFWRIQYSYIQTRTPLSFHEKKIDIYNKKPFMKDLLFNLYTKYCI